jgi:hypothetical protein
MTALAIRPTLHYHATGRGSHPLGAKGAFVKCMWIVAAMVASWSSEFADRGHQEAYDTLPLIRSAMTGIAA